ncbi:hypothetical protein Mgra_00004458, partial [Meloidogyne graminicola]
MSSFKLIFFVHINPLLNYFSLETSPEKVFKELTGMELRSILGPISDQLLQTTNYTKPIIKNKFIDYGITSLDNFLNGRFRSMNRIPYLLEKEKMLKIKNNQTNKKEEEEEENKKELINSSIKGIPSFNSLKIPKIPLINFNNLEEEKELEENNNNKLNNKNKIKNNDIMENKDNNNLILINNKEIYQYGEKPNKQQGIINTLLDFFGVKYLQKSELDQILTELLMENTPKYITKNEKKSGINISSYDILNGLISQPIIPLCSTPLQLINNFNLDAFMGQWFEVMYSRPLITKQLECTTFSFKPLFKTNRTDRIGSLFEIVKYSVPPINNNNNLNQKPKIISGHAILTKPGQIILKNINEPEEINFNILDIGYSNENKRYEWAIIGINCNYPIKIIARDPIIFKQKYSQLTMHLLEKKGLINKFSHFLNFVTNTYPDSKYFVMLKKSNNYYYFDLFLNN